MATESYTPSPRSTACEADPDVAGIGIIISFLITAWLTTLLCIVALFGHPKIKFVLKYLGMVVLQTPKFSTLKCEVIMATISGLDTTQFVTTIGMLIALIATYPESNDLHATLAIGLNVLASSSQTLSLCILARASFLHRAALSIRTIVGFIQNVITLSLFFAWYNTSGKQHSGIFGTITTLNLFLRLAFIEMLILPGVFNFDTAPTLSIFTDLSRRLAEWGIHLPSNYLEDILRADSSFFLFGLFIYGLTATSLSTFAIVDLKWGQSDCNMTQGDDEKWTFGQILALVMMVAVFVSALDAGFEERHKAHKASGRRNSINPFVGPITSLADDEGAVREDFNEDQGTLAVTRLSSGVEPPSAHLTKSQATVSGHDAIP